MYTVRGPSDKKNRNGPARFLYILYTVLYCTVVRGLRAVTIRAVTIRTTPHAFRREACGVFAFYGLL